MDGGVEVNWDGLMEALGDVVFPAGVSMTASDHAESILAEADRTAGATGRSVEYGHPIEDFTRTGRMWAAILGLDEVTPEQVGLCMVAVKISRECNAHKRDNLVDGAGYFKCVELIKERQAESDD